MNISSYSTNNEGLNTAMSSPSKNLFKTQITITISRGKVNVNLREVKND